MLSILRKISLLKNDKGATAIEYALIASLVAVAAITTMSSVGSKTTNVLSNVATTLN